MPERNQFVINTTHKALAGVRKFESELADQELSNVPQVRDIITEVRKQVGHLAWGDAAESVEDPLALELDGLDERYWLFQGGEQPQATGLGHFIGERLKSLDDEDHETAAKVYDILMSEKGDNLSLASSFLLYRGEPEIRYLCPDLVSSASDEEVEKG